VARSHVFSTFHFLISNFNTASQPAREWNGLASRDIDLKTAG
jgi:hypothetical protein